MSDGRHPPWKRWQRWVLILSVLPAGAILLSLTAPWWPGQISANWTMHASFALLPALIICGWRPRWALGILILITIGSCRWIAAGYEQRLPIPGEGSDRLSVVSANVAAWNHWRVQAIAKAGSEHPDILCLVEATDQDRRGLLHDPRWPFQLWTDGLGLLSARPWLTHAVVSAGDTPVLQGTIRFGGSSLRLLAWHATSPTTPSRQRRRTRELDRMGAMVADDPGPVLLMGDFNLTVGDPQWRHFAQISGVLRPVHESASWPSCFGPAGITIDHLLGKRIAITPVSPVWLLGSDHLGISATIAPLP